MKISIFGLGNFGYALLKHFDKKKDKNSSIFAFDRNEKLTNYLRKKHSHLYLYRSTKISKNVNFVSIIKDLVTDCDILVLAVTSDALREVLSEMKPFINKQIILVNTAKALDDKTGKRLSQVTEEIFDNIHFDYALLSGGTIARDLFKHQPLGTDLACKNKKILPFLVKIFASSNLFVYPTSDLVGVEYAAAFKNIISILAGIIRGMGFSYGSETHVISRVASEIEEVVIKNLGGRKETFNMKSQCWGNDMWLSCTGSTRNKEFGILLGKGMSVKKAILEMKKRKKTVEGINTIKVLNLIPEIFKYPLINFLYSFIIKKEVDLDELKKIISNDLF